MALSLGDATSGSFFEDVADKVAALAAAVDQRPHTTAMAVAQLKMYLPDAIHRIRLHDLVMSEVDRLLAEVTGLPMQGDWSLDLYRERMGAYERATATLATLLATGAYFGDTPDADFLLQRALDRLAHGRVEHTGLTLLVEMQRYPVTMALDATGLGAVAAGRVGPFPSAFAQVDVPDLSTGVQPVAVGAVGVIDSQTYKQAHADL